MHQMYILTASFIRWLIIGSIVIMVGFSFTTGGMGLCGCGGSSSDSSHQDIVTPAVSIDLIKLDGTSLELTDHPIPLRLAVQATFSEKMQATTPEQGAFTVVSPNGAIVPGTASWNSENTILTYTLSANLKPKTTYKIKISQLAASTNGIVIPATEQSFVTMTKGDINGDGISDVLIGDDGNRSGDRGKVYVFSGASLSGDKKTSDAMAVITGDPDMLSGFSSRNISMTGDVNADGYEDIIVGNLNLLPPWGPDCRLDKIAVFSGAKLSGNITFSDSLAIMEGERDGDWIAKAFSPAGDINMDGYDDIVVVNEKNAYIFSGKSMSGALKTQNAISTIMPTEANEYMGEMCSGEFVSDLGDVNSDGYQDIVISTYRNEASGSSAGLGAYIFSGKLLTGNITLSQALAKFLDTSLDKIVVSRIGNVNKDSYDDIAIFTRKSTTDSSGRYVSLGVNCYVFSGATISGEIRPSTAIVNITFSDVIVKAIRVGDVNANGTPDIMALRNAAGDIGDIFDLSSLGNLTHENALTTFDLGEDFPGYKISVDDFSGIGDVNLDGYSDVIVGAEGGKSGKVITDVMGYSHPSCEGTAYIFSGASLTGSVSASKAIAVIRGDTDEDSLGSSVAGTY